jgi:hypothetical protein
MFLALNIAVCGLGVGTMIFPWIMPFVINSPIWFGYSGALLIESAIIFICVIFGILIVILSEFCIGYEYKRFFPHL